MHETTFHVVAASCPRAGICEQHPRRPVASLTCTLSAHHTEYFACLCIHHLPAFIYSCDGLV